MGLRTHFKTDQKLEKEGIVVDYGEARIRIARAGGANKRYLKRLEAITKPYRRAIKSETISVDRANELIMQAYAETIVLDWETRISADDEEPQYQRGIDPADAGEAGTGPGDLLPVIPENVLKAFRNLPDLFTDLQEQAQKAALFREEILEADAGN